MFEDGLKFERLSGDEIPAKFHAGNQFDRFADLVDKLQADALIWKGKMLNY